MMTLLISFKGISQTSNVSNNTVMQTLNATGKDAVGSSGTVTYSIGQVFYTYIGQSDYNVTQGIQQEDIKPNAIAGTISGNQSICSNSQPSSIVLTGNRGTIQWQSSTDNVNFTDVVGETTNTLMGNSIGAITLTKYFRAVVRSGVSSATSSTVVIEVPTTTWNGVSWDNGVPTSTTSAIISGNYNLPANINACTLTVNNNAVVVIPSGFNVTLNESIKVSSGSFTLSNNANLIQLSNVANSGNIIVNRESLPLLRLDYSLWSSPVTNNSVNLLSFSPATNTNRFYGFNTSTNLYTAVDPLTTNFSLGQGCLIRMPNDTSSDVKTIFAGSFVGVPNNGTIPVAMANDGIGRRFNLVGNPYPSPISISQFVTDNADNITGTLYFWRKTNNSASPSYCTWTAGTFISNGEVQTANLSEIIQTGQGFIVEALNSATAVTFNNGQRAVNNSNQFFKTKTVEKNRIWLNATNSAGNFSQMAVGYITDATLAVDQYDGKYYNDGVVALNSFLDNTDYVVQGRPLPFDGTDEVPLSFKTTTTGDYTIAIDHVDGLFTNVQDIILKDNEKGIEINLKQNPYTFNASAGVTNTRFSLKYQKTLGVDSSLLDENNVLAYLKEGQIYIKSNKLSIDTVKIYDIRGQLLVEKNNINANEASFGASRYANQVLIVKITSEEGTVVSKKLIN